METKGFQALIMAVIVANSVSVAVETDDRIAYDYADIFNYMDYAFLAVYTIEAILKIYAQPRGYWQSGYNRFDFLILLFSYLLFLQNVLTVLAFFKQVTFLRVLRSLRALRALRGVSFVRRLQVILMALMRTIASIGNLIGILFLLMYVFAIMGFYLFGANPQFSSLGNAFFSLFIFVTADGWTDVQRGLDKISVSSRIYSVMFIWIGNFIFTNLFIGVVIQNLDQATEEDRRAQMERRKKQIDKKKQRILEIQKNDVSLILARRNEDPDMNLQDLLAQMAGKLRHEDLVPMSSLMSNLTWLETYLVSLHHQEVSIYKQQQLHFEIANTLAEILDKRLEEEGKRKRD